MSNPFDFFKDNALKIKEAFNQSQKELEYLHLVGEAGAGMVKVTINGHKKILKVTIEDSIYKTGKSVVEELMVGAVQDALSKADQAQRDRISQVMSRFGLPPGFSFPFNHFPSSNETSAG